MKSYLNSTNLKILAYATFYWLVMANGLDLVQSQASQMLPYLSWLNNPELYPNDIMGMTFPYYSDMSLYYKLAGWLGHILSPMAAIHVIFFIQCFVEVFGLRFFALRLFPDKPMSYTWIVIILFTFGGALRHSLGSVAPFGWTVFPDTLATSIMLFACGFLLEKRFIPVFLLTAFCINIHLGIASLLFCAFSIMYLYYYKEVSLRPMIITGIVCALMVLPLGIKIITTSYIPMTADFGHWLNSMIIHQGHHTFLSQLGLIQYLPFGFWMVLFIVSIKYQNITNELRVTLQFFTAILFLMAIATVFVEVFNNQIAITLSFVRSTRYLTIIGAFFTVAFYFDLITKYDSLRKLLVITGVSFLVFLSCANLLLYHQTYRNYPEPVVEFINDIYKKENSAIQSTLFYQTIKHSKEYVESWKKTQVWCRENTPVDKMILSPYYLRGFRSFSERSIVFQFRDPNFAKYKPWYFILDVCNEIMEIIGAPFEGYDDPIEFQLVLEELYKNYTLEDILDMAKVLNFEYIVTEQDHILPLSLKYNNKYFNIYKLEDSN